MDPKTIKVPPLQIKSTLKLVRWVSLISGIIYGFGKRRKYAAIEKVIHDEEERLRPEREARERCEKLRHQAAEMRALEKEFLGTTSPEPPEDEPPCEGVPNENETSEDTGEILNGEEEDTITNCEIKEEAATI